jgi:hypothetical protein
MKSLTLFYPYVEPHCSGVSIPMMRQALRSSAIEFCERTNATQEVFTTGTTVDVNELDIDVPSQQRLVRVLSAQYQDKWLTLVPTQDAPNLQYEPTTGEPTHLYLAAPNTGPSTLYPTPDATEANVLFIRASYAPTRTASQLADSLFDEWVETIAAGAISRLQSTAGTPFYSPDALMWKSTFERGVSKALVLDHRGRVRVSQRVQPRPFA